MSLPIKPGDLLVNRYRVDSYHASGGMQHVFLAHDATLDRAVVIKTPKSGVADRRFRRGAEMSARINHPNVAATLDYFEDDSITFVVEEFIPGMDLSKRLSADFEYMDPYLAMHVVHNVARSLYEAHRSNICHRDIKPSNVMVSPDPGLKVIKLTDFGIAKLAQTEIDAEMRLFEQDESTLTSSNTLLGAVPYMAPECWSDWQSAGSPMDIWALGCIGVQLLSGSPPFGVGRAAIAAVARAEHLGVELQKPTWFGRHPASEKLEDELWTLLLDCLNVNPVSRPIAKEIVLRCEKICYPNYDRELGTISRYGAQYSNGGKGTWGHIVDANETPRFFHIADFFGGTPSVGQRVSFCHFPGTPLDRCTPVTLLRSQ